MAAKYSQVSGIIRTYENEDSYEKRSAYVSVVSVIWTSENRAVLFGAHGEGQKQNILDVFSELYALGARTVEMSRAKGRRMPFGVLVRSEGDEDWYEINLDTVLKK